MEMLIKSQNGELTILGRVVSIGKRTPIETIGEQLKSLMDAKGMSDEDLIKVIGTSYRSNVVRLLNNDEIPSKKMIEKLCSVFDVKESEFYDKELNNVIITDNNIVIAKYDTNDRALEVKKALDEIIIENYKNGTPIVLVLPEK